MPNVITVDGLTDKERKFVEGFAAGMTQSQAAREAGYERPHEAASRLLKKPQIINAVQALHAQNAQALSVTRKDVLDGFAEAIEMGKQLQDPVAMIAGWREVAKVCGFYEPTKKEIQISVNGRVQMDRLEQLPDNELMRLIEAETIEVVAEEIEGEEE